MSDQDDLRDLYQDLILDHSRHPRGHRAMPDADRRAEGYNPLCGDQVTVHLKLGDDRVKDASFTGQGCAICTASASMMMEAVKGRRIDDAEQLFDRFHDAMVGRNDAAGELPDALQSLLGVRRFPMRVKCATLPWHTLRAALRGGEADVTTE